ncbi:hypothetical protein [Sphingomonas sp. 3P27F8]|uniref:hypothetical protein n=1 Tax=Sphingomonas sp. 3P27F8 TaxID=2502213 RepID=UPI0020165332|nr:hypothetical protein [Sphingomonas sp. 3P27F8]
MDVATTPAFERIARVLAGQHFSRNADGNDAHAAETVDTQWADFRDDAISVLKTLREPDAEMERAGDIAVWGRMIAAALGDPAGDRAALAEAPEPGTDPLHEGP